MRKHRLQYWILATDLIWVTVALPVAYLLRFRFVWNSSRDASFGSFIPSLLLAALLWVILFLSMKLDGFQRGWNLSAILSQLFVAISLLIIIVMAGGYILRVFPSRLTLTYFSVLLFGGFSAIRCLAHTFLGSKFVARAVRRVVIVGNGPVAREMATKIDRHPEMLCQLVGFLCSADTSIDARISDLPGKMVTLQTLGLVDLLRGQQVDEIIITSAKPGSPEILNLSTECRRAGIGVSVVPHPYELYLSKPQLIDVGGLPVLQLAPPKSSFANGPLKRCVDVCVGVCLVPLAIPFVLIGAIALLGKKGGPFTREVRCGKFGKQFWMYRLNSDRDCPDVLRYEKILQQLSITEVPQLWNVLRGEMSIIGPRPESPERVKHYSDWQRQRLNVKPGITGLAQVYGLREQHSSEEKARFDLQYMMHASIFFDFSLMLQTGWTLFSRLSRLRELSSPRTQRIREIAITDRLLERPLPNAHSTQSSAD